MATDLELLVSSDNLRLSVLSVSMGKELELSICVLIESKFGLAVSISGLFLSSTLSSFGYMLSQFSLALANFVLNVLNDVSTFV